MLTHLIDFSLSNRFLVIVFVLLMAACGAFLGLHIPIDAVPDMTNIQVQIVTEAGALSPLEVERLVTYPVESSMAGLPNLAEIRSITRFGISVVTVVFEEGTDLYRARQLVNERIIDAKSKLPAGFRSPEIGLLATALGEVLQFEVRGKGYTVDGFAFIVAVGNTPLLRQVPGVIDINSQGGFYKSFEVQLDPNRMAGEAVGLE